MEKKFAAPFLKIYLTDIFLGMSPPTKDKVAAYKGSEEYRNGWRDACKEAHNQMDRAFESLHTMNTQAAALVIAEVANLVEGKLYLQIGSVFDFAIADSEEVPNDKIHEVYSLFTSYGFIGICYWVSVIRGCKSVFEDFQQRIEWVKEQVEKDKKKHEDRFKSVK